MSPRRNRYGLRVLHRCRVFPRASYTCRPPTRRTDTGSPGPVHPRPHGPGRTDLRDRLPFHLLMCRGQTTKDRIDGSHSEKQTREPWRKEIEDSVISKDMYELVEVHEKTCCLGSNY